MLQRNLPAGPSGHGDGHPALGGSPGAEMGRNQEHCA